MREIDLAEFNPLGKVDSTQRNLANEPNIERLKAEIEHFKKETEKKYIALYEKYFSTEISDEAAKAVIAKYPTVDFGEGKKWLSIAEEAYLTEEKYTLIVPILTKLEEVKLHATGQKLFRSEYVDLKRKLLDVLMDIFSSPMQIPTFEWTIEQLKELEMIPHQFSALEMESNCALGRWN